MLFNSESHPSHILNKRKFGISNPWCCENLLNFTSTLIPAGLTLSGDCGWILGLCLHLRRWQSKVVCRASPFTGQPRSYLSEPYWSLWSETGPAVCFTASDNDATELRLTVLIALDSYRFLENKTCPLCHAQIDQSQQDRQNKAAGRLRCALHCVEALPPAWAGALSGQRALQATVNSSSVVPQRFAIKPLLSTRAHKKNEDQTKVSWHLV